MAAVSHSSHWTELWKGSSRWGAVWRGQGVSRGLLPRTEHRACGRQILAGVAPRLSVHSRTVGNWDPLGSTFPGDGWVQALPFSLSSGHPAGPRGMGTRGRSTPQSPPGCPSTQRTQRAAQHLQPHSPTCFLQERVCRWFSRKHAL